MTDSLGDRPLQQVLEENLGHIKAVIAQSCRSSHFSPQNAEDFEGEVMLKLITDDYAVIRRFRGDKGATLKTYLTTVIKRALLDYKDHIWGKYRASAKAKELGPVAVRLEMLLVRDGYTFGEASEVLRTNEGVMMSEGELADLGGKLPNRVLKDSVGEEPLAFLPGSTPNPEEESLEKEREIRRRQVYKVLKQALDTLPLEKHTLVKLWLHHPIADIARIRKVEQKPLYRQMSRLLDELRKTLERQSVRREDIQSLLAPLADDLGPRPSRTSG